MGVVRRLIGRDTSTDQLADFDERRVRAVLLLSGMPVDGLDDGVQQVRLKILEQPPGRIRDVRAWSAVVAGTVAADWHRVQGRQRQLVEALAARADLPGRLSRTEDRALAMTVAAGLQRLSVEQRQLVVLRFYVDLSVKQIATALRVPEGTVKSRLHTAVGLLREELRRMEVG